MILRKLVFCFSILVGVNVFGMITPPLKSGSGEAASQPATPERGFRTPLQPDTGGEKSATQSPARGDLLNLHAQEYLATGFNALMLQLADIENDLHELNERTIRRGFSAGPEFLGSNTKKYGKNDFIMAYVFTEIFCEVKKSFFYRKKDDVCKADIYFCDVNTLTRCAQRIAASVLVGSVKGFLASHALEYGIKALVLTHFLMQSLECFFDYLNLHESFQHDKKCYTARMIVPGLLFFIKMLIRSLGEDFKRIAAQY